MGRVKRLSSKIDRSNDTVRTLPEWGGFSREDPVKIVGERGLYAFMGYCENVKTGESWVALFGGDKDPNGRQQFRYVNPDRIQSVKKRRKNG